MVAPPQPPVVFASAVVCPEPVLSVRAFARGSGNREKCVQGAGGRETGRSRGAIVGAGCHGAVGTGASGGVPGPPRAGGPHRPPHAEGEGPAGVSGAPR